MAHSGTPVKYSSLYLHLVDGIAIRKVNTNNYGWKTYFCSSVGYIREMVAPGGAYHSQYVRETTALFKLTETKFLNLVLPPTTLIEYFY